jgi:hypothetical protein
MSYSEFPVARPQTPTASSPSSKHVFEKDKKIRELKSGDIDMADAADVLEKLAELRDEVPTEDEVLIIEFEDLFDRKLWHQLTDKLLEYFNRDASGPVRLRMFNDIIVKFAKWINQLKLVKLALSAATQCKGRLTTLPSMIGS